MNFSPCEIIFQIIYFILQKTFFILLNLFSGYFFILFFLMNIILIFKDTPD